MKILLIIFFFAIRITSLVADSILPPCDYAKASANDRYVFVMLVPDGAPRIDDYRNDGLWEGIESIRSIYPQSGLYRIDDTATPLWTVNWFASDILPCSDGIHLIRLGPWASNHDDEALSFFANGELIKSYRINDLVDFPSQLPHSVSHFEWESELLLVSDEKRLQLRTLNGECYVFDVATGQIVESSKPVRRLNRRIGATVLFVSVPIFSWLLWKFWKRTASSL